MNFNDHIRQLVENNSSGSDWARFNCPVCHLNGESRRDSKKSLSYNPTTGFYQCWRCAIKGTLFDRTLKGKFNSKQVSKKVEFALPGNYYHLFKGEGLQARSLKKYRDYVNRRRITQETSRLAGIGACAIGYWANRVIVPCYSGCRLLGWSARSLRNDVFPKYLYPKGMSRKDIVFNQDALSLDTNEPLFIVEGVFDALTLYPNAVALLGKPSNNHANLFLECTRPLIVAFDGDAHEEGWAFATKLKMSDLDVLLVKLPAGEDPSSVGNNWVNRHYIRL